MSEGTGAKVTEQGLNLLFAFIPAVISTILGVLGRPFDEKLKVERQRKNLLDGLRFKISIEVSQVIPVKNFDDTQDDYVLICREGLKEYFASNSGSLIDLINTEKIFTSYIRYFKLFKYAFVGIPIFAIISGILLALFNKLSLNLCLIGILFSLVIIGILWFIMENRKDKFSDLCSKYEIVCDEK